MISLYSADTGESMVAFKPKVYKGKNNTEKVRDSQECFAQVLLVFVHAFNIYMWFKGKLYIISSERESLSMSGLYCYRDAGNNIQWTNFFARDVLWFFLWTSQ